MLQKPATSPFFKVTPVSRSKLLGIVAEERLGEVEGVNGVGRRQNFPQEKSVAPDNVAETCCCEKCQCWNRYFAYLHLYAGSIRSSKWSEVVGQFHFVGPLTAKFCWLIVAYGHRLNEIVG